jgi:HPt (histidine-containing phosphotransfer) domain-containing protein
MGDSAVQQARLAVAELWARFRPTIMERLGVLAQATAALEEHRLSDSLRLRAEQEAHKLAGSLGSFGFADCTPLARAIEMHFRPDALLTTADVADLREKVAALRRELEKPPAV